MGQSTRGARVSVDLPTLSIKETAGATPGFDDKFGSVAPFTYPRAVNLVGGRGVIGIQVEDLVIQERLDFLAVCLVYLRPVFDDLGFSEKLVG